MTDNKKLHFKSPLSVARSDGSTLSGTHHWMHERITSAASIPLMIWLVWSVTHFGVLDYATFTAWLAQPLNAVLMILSIITTFYHAALGAQVIIEDYMHNEGYKLAQLICIKLFFFASAVATVFSILKIAFAG